MAVAAPAGRIGGRRFGSPERAFLLLAVVTAVVAGGITYSVDRGSPSIETIHDRIADATYEDLLPAEFEFKHFVDSSDKDSLTEERSGVAKFGKHTHIAYSVYSDPNLAESVFDDHRSGHVLAEDDPPMPGIAKDRYLGQSRVASQSFCVDLGWAAECIALDGNAIVTGLAVPTKAEVQAGIDRTVEKAELLLESGLATLEIAR